MILYIATQKWLSVYVLNFLLLTHAHMHLHRQMMETRQLWC